MDHFYPGNTICRGGNQRTHLKCKRGSKQTTKVMKLQETQTELDNENMMIRMGLVERIEKVIGPRKVLLQTGKNEAENKTGVITLIMIKVNNRV